MTYEKNFACITDVYKVVHGQMEWSGPHLNMFYIAKTSTAPF